MSLPFSAYIRSPRVAAHSEKNSKVEINKLLSGLNSKVSLNLRCPNSYQLYITFLDRIRPTPLSSLLSRPLSSFAVILPPIDSPIRWLASIVYQRNNYFSICLLSYGDDRIKLEQLQELVVIRRLITCLNSARFVSAGAVFPLLAESIAV